MHSPAVRYGVVALLLVAGAAAAAQWWRHDADLRSLDERLHTLDMVADRVIPAAADVAAAQRAYVAYGLRDEATFARIADLIRQLTADVARFRVSTASPESAAGLDDALGALANLTAALAQARERMQAAEPLAAADALLGSAAQQQVAALLNALDAFRSAELQWVRDRRTTIDGRLRVTFAAVALLWVAGLLALAQGPREPAKRAADSAASPVDESLRTSSGPVDRSRVDLSAAARVCTEIARLADAAALPALLERAAAVLDARGIMVWMGAGDELFPVAGFGYDRAMMQRLRPIPRGADNATAAAWRTGALRTVPFDASGPGAIVAPMCAPDGCVGVLAAEVRRGREADPDVRAAAEIIAAQLANALAAWPAGSATAGDNASAAAGPGQGESEGNAAAS